MMDTSPDGLGPSARWARARDVLSAAEEGAAQERRRVADRDRDVPQQVRADPEPDPHDVARQIALRQLTLAPRSRKQLEDKLRQRGCDDGVASAVLDRLTEVGLVDDEAYARMLVRSRQETRGLAPRALTQELRRKGVADEIIEETLAHLDPDDDVDRVRSLVDKRLRTMRGLNRQVQTRRLAGFLARKGYDSTLAFRVIREALDELPEHRRD